MFTLEKNSTLKKIKVAIKLLVCCNLLEILMVLGEKKIRKNDKQG